MHGEGFFFQAFVYLTAAVVAVPIAKRIGLGSVLGYLAAGIVIGPFALGLIGAEGQDVMHFAEFGVVIMLFLIGLELEPQMLWRLRGRIVGLGGLQVLVSTAAIAAVVGALGLPIQQAVAIGLILALSSTAIVMQTLEERHLSGTEAGRSSFSILLFQDIAVIPILALMPLLATEGLVPAAAEHGEHGSTWVAGLPGWAQTIAVLGTVVGLVVVGHFVVKPSFRFLARTRQREVFVAGALLLVISIALLMANVGLSPALGTFVAGVVLANSEYRHELESDIDPFKGLLLGLFFISVGASIDFGLVVAQPSLIAGGVAALLLVKALVLFGLARAFALGMDNALLVALALAQGGEFAFVLLSFAEQSGVLPATVSAPVIVIVVMTMLISPLLLTAAQRWLLPYIGTRETVAPSYDDPTDEHNVIIAGYGRMGQIIERVLSTMSVRATMLEYDPDQVELLRRFGREVYYGDATRYDLLEAAGARQAKVLIIAIDDYDKTRELVETVRKHFPQLHVVARVPGRVAAYELIAAGVDDVFRETFDTSLAIGARTLELLGRRSYAVHRATRALRRRDESLVRELAAHRASEDFVAIARERLAETERLLQREHEAPSEDGLESAWDGAALAARRQSTRT